MDPLNVSSPGSDWKVSLEGARDIRGTRDLEKSVILSIFVSIIIIDGELVRSNK